ncbi:MAG: carbohydrate ABC transporter permease, partial [Bacillota bacterium]
MKDTGARRLGNHAMIHLVLILGAVAMVFPFYWVVCTSFKTNYEAISFPPTLFPREPVFSNYGKALAAAPFGRYFLNSVIQAGGVSVGVLITSILAAYAFANMRFAGKNVIFTIVLATMMVPAEVTLIPNFVIIKKMGLYNTYLALILPFVGHVFSIFLLRQSFLNVPRDLYEAAAIDGCSHFRYLLDVMLPLSIPGISVVGLLAF